MHTPTTLAPINIKARSSVNINRQPLTMAVLERLSWQGRRCSCQRPHGCVAAPAAEETLMHYQMNTLKLWSSYQSQQNATEKFRSCTMESATPKTAWSPVSAWRRDILHFWTSSLRFQADVKPVFHKKIDPSF